VTYSAAIFIINRDGTHLRRLTQVRLRYGSPTFSPNGRMIAFTRNAAQIYRMNIDGSGIRQLTREGSRLDSEPTWSVTGRIAFTSELKGATGGTSDIRVMNADGSHLRSLAHSSADEREPAWSPSGRKIAFSASQAPHRTWIYVMNADGRGRRALTHPAASDDHEPTWSPDGRTIAFARTGSSGKGDIFLVNIDGSGLRRLTTSGANDYLPAWSPR
jgi:Tol biopolymer transport system component